MLELVYRFLCLAGILVSIYGQFVATSRNRDPSYKAACDFGSYFSCSTALTSEYSKGFGIIGPLLGSDNVLNISNSLYGVGFYFVLLLISGSRSDFMLKLMLLAGVLSCGISIFLAYILYAVLHDFCMVCVTVYVINILLFITATARLRGSTSRKAKQSRHTQ